MTGQTDTILHGDCIELLNQIPEKSVDLIFADPPYNLQLQQELYRPNRSLVDAVQDHWDRFSGFEEYDAFSRAWLSGCRRVLKDNGTLWVIGTYHNIYRLGATLQDLGFWFLNDIVWVKTNPMPNFKGVRFTNAHETLLWVSKSKDVRYTFNYHSLKTMNDDLQMRSDWLLPICNGSDRLRSADGQKIHSTQKPEAILYRILLACSNPGDIILDPFFGSGTTGVVSKRLHRHWIGIEKEARYVEAARQRIEATPAVPYGESFFQTESRPKRADRIPFGRVMEEGLLSPGDTLFFKGKRDITAHIRADAKLILNDSAHPLSGSIHRLASHLSNGSPCNGWDLWFFMDSSGKLEKLDALRQKIREMNGNLP